MNNDNLQSQFQHECKEMAKEYAKAMEDLERKENLKCKTLITKYKAKGLKLEDLLVTLTSLLDELRSE